MNLDKLKKQASEGLEIAEKATKGPFEVVWKGSIPTIEAVNRVRGVRPCGDQYPRIARMAAGYAPDEANAELFAHARTSYPAMCRAVLRLTEMVGILAELLISCPAEMALMDECPFADCGDPTEERKSECWILWAAKEEEDEGNRRFPMSSGEEGWNERNLPEVYDETCERDIKRNPLCLLFADRS